MMILVVSIYSLDISIFYWLCSVYDFKALFVICGYFFTLLIIVFHCKFGFIEQSLPSIRLLLLYYLSLLPTKIKNRCLITII